MKPIIGITMGDPAGVGPEISAKVLTDPDVLASCRPILFGSASIFSEAIELLQLSCEINKISSISDAKFQINVVNIWDFPELDHLTIPKAEVSEQGGRAAFFYIKKVIELAMAGEIDGTVTNPINKESLNLAGFHFAGHTEIYAHFTKTDRYNMMLAEKKLRVIHVSTHVSLKDAITCVKQARELETIEVAHDACLSLGLTNPKIAVAGLNPHCGENGLFGQEEIDEIIPAIEQAKQKGINVYGPIPADTVFSRALGGEFDIVVVQYHDQGHIPLKLLGFRANPVTGEWDSVSGVNITLGLPIIRTSVDHGTAFNIAWRGIARSESLIDAINYAVLMISNQAK